MALTQQTQWHGNPRPRKAYQWTDNSAVGESPYYKDNRTVPLYVHGVSLVPFAEVGDDPTGNIDTAGPAALVSVSLAGPFPVGTVINWVFTGDVSGAHADTYTVDSSRSNGMSPEEVIADIVGILNADLGADGVASIGGNSPRQMDVIPAGANAAFTATTWTVTPPA